MDSFQQLRERVISKNATICVVGMGYVGLPLVRAISQAGFKKIFGLDIDEDKVDKINGGDPLLETLTREELGLMLKSGFSSTIDYSVIAKSDILIICVPTPVNKYKEPDLSFIQDTIDKSKEYFHKSMFISLESTTYPGTTNEIIANNIEALGFEIGKDFFIGYSPEREDPGNHNFTTATIPKVISGVTDNCLEICENFYGSFIDTTVPVSNPRTAEMVKLIENIQRSVNIGLMNELKIVAEKMNIDVFEVIRAAGTKPFGFIEYMPGPGVGGHCIPIDPLYLTWKAKEFNVHSRFIELAAEINAAMPSYVVSKTIDVLNMEKKSLSESKLLILGLSYKKNVSDLRESPNLEIMKKLIDMGSTVDYVDPFFEEIPKLRKYNFKMKSKKISSDLIKTYDVILMLTDHDDFDYRIIKKNAKKIIDTRGVFKKSNKVFYA